MASGGSTAQTRAPITTIILHLSRRLSISIGTPDFEQMDSRTRRRLTAAHLSVRPPMTPAGTDSIGTCFFVLFYSVWSRLESTDTNNARARACPEMLTNCGTPEMSMLFLWEDYQFMICATLHFHFLPAFSIPTIP
jgi:hypothetical protein